MRLSVVFELLLVFLFLAFAAARVIDVKSSEKNVAKANKTKTTVLRQGPPNRYCACTSRMCNCCRDFSLPVVPIKGPGCASIMYVQRDTMMVTMSFGDRVLSNTTITGRTPKPICMALPGGISQFCGRIYGISRKGDQFRACLGLELRALDDIEAALRVSCFKFGPKGVKLESAPPVPAETSGKDPEEEEDDDDYDLDDDDDDDDDLIGFGDDEDDGTSNEDNEVDSDPVDYTGFSVLGEDLLGTFFSDDSGLENTKKKKITKKTVKPQVLVPKFSTTTRRPVLTNIKRSTAKPNRATLRPLINKVIKKPRPKPQIVQTLSSGVPSLMSLQTTSSVTLPTVNREKNKPLKRPMTPASSTAFPSSTIFEKDTQEMENETTSNLSYANTSEAPVTFTAPTKIVEIVKHDVKIPQIDLEKLEAVAAIAQQDVTSGVISSTSVSSPDSSKLAETITIKYEKVTPETIYTFANEEKINSVKFVPTITAASKPDLQINSEGSLSDETGNGELSEGTEVTAIKNRITAYYQNTETTVSDNENKEDENDNYSENENEKYEILQNNKLHTSPDITSENFTIVSVKKQKIKPHHNQNDNEEDVLVEELSDGNEKEILNEKIENNFTAYTTTNNKPNNNMNIEESNEGIDISEDFTEVHKKVKPSKVEITKIKPLPSESDSEEEDEDEDEDEDDLLGSLENDDDNDEKADEQTEDEVKTTTQKTKVKITKPTVHTNEDINTKKPIFHTSTKEPTFSVGSKTKTKLPGTQIITSENPFISQTFVIRQPSATTEKVFKEKIRETTTEKIFIYQPPSQKVTEKVILYQRPEIPEKVFVYTEPTNMPSEASTEKVLTYEKPVKSFTEKILIFKEPAGSNTVEPVQFYNDNGTKVSVEEDGESKEEAENDEDDEEDTDDESDSEKGILFASIVKDGSEFSNKYLEEHDLTESDDLDIEDPEEETTDYEEERKFKEKKIFDELEPISKVTVNSGTTKSFTSSDLQAKSKKNFEKEENSRPISSSRTHRRMNLDRLWPK